MSQAQDSIELHFSYPTLAVWGMAITTIETAGPWHVRTVTVTGRNLGLAWNGC